MSKSGPSLWDGGCVEVLDDLDQIHIGRPAYGLMVMLGSGNSVEEMCTMQCMKRS